jgi:hypothetical protein
MFLSIWFNARFVYSLFWRLKPTQLAQTMDEGQSAISCIGELHAVYPGRPSTFLKGTNLFRLFRGSARAKDATDQGV